MYTRGQSGRRGMGQTCSSALSPGNCAGAGGSYDDVNEVCNCGVSPAIPAIPSVPTASCAAGASSACSWYDNIWATQGCLNWYAACDPTNAFYLTNTQGLIAGGSAVLGATAANAVSGALQGAAASSGSPAWALVAGAIALALYVLPKVVK